MAIGDLYQVERVPDVYYLDTGMYDTAEYGSVYAVDAERPAIVDTGIGTRYENILDALREVGIAPGDLAYIVPTHVHLDHAGGGGFLADECEDATVVCHENGARHLVDPGRLWEGTKRAVGDEIDFYTEPEPVPVERVRQVSGGDTVDLGDRELAVCDAPGHAPHQAFFHDPDADAVYTGDAAGIYVPSADAVGPTTPPPNFDFEQCLEDTRAIRRLEPDTLLFGHFGPAGNADDLLADHLAALTDWVKSVAAARSELGGDEAVVERFAGDPPDHKVDAWGEPRARAEVALNTRGVLDYLDERGDFEIEG
jgi:glyoxylase-like metal-dependent hydrolase (beta-lactamase superfamily II)